MKHTHLLLSLLTSAALTAAAQQTEQTPDVRFTGYVSYADQWSGDSGNYPLCGFYSFSRDNDAFEQLTNDEWQVIARNSGTLVKDKVYAFYTDDSWMFPDPKLYIYDASTWKRERTISYGRDEKYAMADLTYDPTTESLLAVAYDYKRASGNGHYYRIDLNTGALTEVAAINDLYLACAADAQGNMWVLNAKGMLNRITPQGRVFCVGDTGYRLQNEEPANSMAFDLRTGRLYWAASVYVPGSYDDLIRGLFEIDTTTGAATLLRTFSGSELVTALSVQAPTSVVAPDDVLDLHLQPTTPGALTGEVCFTVPSKNYIQGALPQGNLTARIWVDGVEQTSESVVPGSEVEIPIVTNEVGMHTVWLQLTDAEGRKGQMFTAKRYFGFDKPCSVTNVELKYDEDRKQATLTWNPVQKGVNEGDIDTSTLRYLVTRYSPGEKEDVAADLSDCNFTESVDRPMAYTRYGVVAYDAREESTPTYSEYGHLGTPLPLPFSSGLNSWGDFHKFIVIDANGDGYNDWGTPSWYYDEAYGAAFCYLTRDEQQDDWLVTPALSLVPGQGYQVIFQTYGYYGYTDHIQLAVGSHATAEGLSRVVYDKEFEVPMPTKFPYESNDVLTVGAVFVAQPGDSYVGFHNISAKSPQHPYTDHMSIDNIYIRAFDASGVDQVTTTTVPSACYDLQGRTLQSGAQSAGLYIVGGHKRLVR